MFNSPQVILIDGEHPVPGQAELVAQCPEACLIVFTSEPSGSISPNTAALLYSLQRNVELITDVPIRVPDLAVAFTVGQLFANHPDAEVMLISQNTDHDLLVMYAQQQGRSLSLWSGEPLTFSVADLDPKSDTDMKMLAAHIDALGRARPKTWQEMFNLIQEMANNVITMGRTQRYISGMSRVGAFRSVKGKIFYSALANRPLEAPTESLPDSDIHSLARCLEAFGEGDRTH